MADSPGGCCEPLARSESLELTISPPCHLGNCADGLKRSNPHGHFGRVNHHACVMARRIKSVARLVQRCSRRGRCTELTGRELTSPVCGVVLHAAALHVASMLFSYMAPSLELAAACGAGMHE